MGNSIAIRSNLQIIQQAFADFAQGNIAAIIDVCADDVLWGGYKIPDVPISGNFFGKEGVLDFFTRLSGQVNYKVFNPREFIVQDDNVVVLGHHEGTVKNTGKDFNHDWCFHFKMQEGKVKNYFAFTDTYDHFKAFR